MQISTFTNNLRFTGYSNSLETGVIFNRTTKYIFKLGSNSK